MTITPVALKALSEGDLDNFITGSTPGGIEAQEAEGQALLVASCDMPKDMSPTKEAYEAVGFNFGDDVDDIFVSSSLPSGWTRKATDHSMHSDIMDERGRRRVGVFYKAAFYDRSAHASMIRRFSSGIDYSRSEGDVYHVCVMDQGVPIKEIGTVKKDDFEAQRELEKQARGWLDESYPNHADPTAHWLDQ